MIWRPVADLVGLEAEGGADFAMNCVGCGLASVTERREVTAQGHQRFRCGDCGWWSRLTHHVDILEMNGDSYRLKQSKR